MSDEAAGMSAERGEPRRLLIHVVGFLAFSHGWTWGFWALAAAIGDSVWAAPAVYAFYVGGAGVLLGGLLMTGFVGGRGGLRDLAARVLDPRRIGWPWWLAILAGPFVLVGLAATAGAAVGLTAAPLAPEFPAGGLLATLSLLGFLLIIGPLPEEVGWRGFLLHRLLGRWPPVPAGLFVGLLWWIWHAPLHVLPGYFDPFGNPPSFVWQLATLLPASVVYAFVYLGTRRSVLAVVVLHWTVNLSGEILRPAEGLTPVIAALWVAVAAALVAAHRPRSTGEGSR